MSPPMSFLGFVSIPTVWVITYVGLPPDLWTFGIIPVLSIYFLCDQEKLREAAGQVRGWVLGTSIAVLFSVLYARFPCTSFILWKVGVLLVWLLCLATSFDFEKKMYTTDTCGAVSKYLVWKVITRFTGEAMWMGYKGEWACCSPYTRKVIRSDIKQYYNLQKRSEEQEIIPENYLFDFRIGSCDVKCAYTPAYEDPAASSAHYSPPSALVSSPVESHASPMSGVDPHEKERADAESAGSSTTTSREGESSSTKADNDPIVKDKYVLVSSHFNKVEVCLKYENKPLESYTLYNIASDAVAEWKRVLAVLKNEGNVIFANLSREIGSSRPRAHARCHEFGELAELVLTQSYKLHAVDLGVTYKCIISGRHWMFQLQPVLLVVVMIAINYYQLTGPPKDLSTAIILLTCYAFVQLFFILVNHACSDPQRLSRFVYFLIKRIVPSKVDVCYRYFQVHLPAWTFCNESYCYPYTSKQKKLCILETPGGVLRFPLLETDRPKFFNLVGDLKEGKRVFSLINLELEIYVHELHRGNEVQVEVILCRTYDRFLTRDFFQTNKSRAADLISLMTWLEENNSPGVCKEWPRSGLMHAYRYEELFRKILREGLRPMIVEIHHLIEITVE